MKLIYHNIILGYFVTRMTKDTSLTSVQVGLHASILLTNPELSLVHTGDRMSPERATSCRPATFCCRWATTCCQFR